ncbi:MAG: TonB-dependent receptor [Alphaproteobacteria bacterium]|uniref:Colicin I receptor n=2 Tax=Brevundimonas mediterranea TaxID=74329 RepID=A0A7Z8Y1S5_9CAUL|nr:MULTISPECIES: TonB-dependent receptor [Brevundimonas]MBU4197368.1 TonB-dependent receptor [Alphaproteobacteria bacterium]MBU4238456.1 TonB-dependent receptor [Alphaproteobacteria bacterium]MCG2664890.1 TonB-dependent receptor [Brevundimonas sp.]VDC49124.1 Colicin I receptor [Brevundimonas mediterranea]
MASEFKTRLMAAAALTGVMAAAHGAQAQSAEPATLDEIIVTAQLRAQKTIEVPFALTAYSGQFLEDLGIQEFEQLSAFVPGFLVQNQSPNNPGFVMRGITSDSGAATAEPRVSVFQDGVSISKSRGSYVELFDLERVEIAKGPQSTLYGRGALIGAVNLVQNRAQPGETEAYANIEAGNEDYRMVEGALNLPVGETGGLRLATRLKTRGGSVENLLGGEDYNAIETKAVRLSGAWAPSDAMRFDVIGNYQNDHASGTSFKSIAYEPADPNTGAVLGGKEPWEGAALTPGGDFDGGKTLGLSREVWGVTGLARINLNSAWTLNSTTAYREFDNYETFDADGVSLPILTAAEETHGEQWSQDLRLGFDNGGRLTGFVGAGWFHEEGYQRAPAQFDERLVLAQLAGLLDGSPTAVGDNTLPLSVYPTVARNVLTSMLTPLGAGAYAAPITANLDSNHIETSTNSSELTSYDVFADATYAFTDKFEMSAGVRYTRDDKTTGYASSVDSRSALGALLAIQAGAIPAAQVPAFLAAMANPAFANLPASVFPLFGLTSQPTANNGDFSYYDSEDDGVTWRVTARYELTDDTNVYANYARGRRPEVISASGPSAPGGAARFSPVDAETVDSYEIGAKSALLDGRLRVDGAVFMYNYENFQTTIQQGTQFITTNAGEAKSYGFEGQANFAVASMLDLFATYAYNHSRFENGIYDGNKFRLSPDNAASIGATWRLPVTGGEIEVQPTYTWQSKVFFEDDNDRPDLQTVASGAFVADLIQDEYQDAYGLLNLRIRYTPDSTNWGVEAFGENILDEEYIKDAGNTGDALGMPTFIAGRPAAYGLVFKLKL